MTLYEYLPDAIRETVDEIVEVLRPERGRTDSRCGRGDGQTPAVDAHQRRL
jgi:hypothetical protein